MSKNDLKIVPVGKKIVLKPLDPTKEADFGGIKIVIPPTARDEDRPDQGIVMAVGPLVGKADSKDGCCCDDDCSCEEYETPIKVGKKVLFSKYSPTKIEWEGEKYLIVSESDILAVIED